MNAKTLLSLVVAIALGLAATWVGRNIILGNRTLGGGGPEMVRVVVAKTDLEPGRVLLASDLTTMEVPSGSKAKTMFADPKELAGRAVLSPVVKGQTMFEGLLAAPGSEGGLTALVPEGKRAVAVEVNESSAVAGLLNPGCRVDVIATLRAEDGGTMNQMARTIVENVKVQAVNRRMAREKNEDPGQAAVKTVTLIVSPKDAEAIELASNSGKLRLVLRGATDTAPTASIGVTYSELTGKVTAVPYAAPTWKTETPKADSGSGIEKFLTAMLNQPSAQPEPQPSAVRQPPHAIRQAVRIIRGNSESTIYYELQPPRPGQTADEWSVSSAGQNAENQEKQDPFGTNR
jgi:pilus assembly protein CpaB